MLSQGSEFVHIWELYFCSLFCRASKKCNVHVSKQTTKYPLFKMMHFHCSKKLTLRWIRQDFYVNIHKSKQPQQNRTYSREVRHIHPNWDSYCAQMKLWCQVQYSMCNSLPIETAKSKLGRKIQNFKTIVRKCSVPRQTLDLLLRLHISYPSVSSNYTPPRFVNTKVLCAAYSTDVISDSDFIWCCHWTLCCLAFSSGWQMETQLYKMLHW